MLLLPQFFRENCPHCVRLAPVYGLLADSLNNTAGLKFGEVWNEMQEKKIKKIIDRCGRLLLGFLC
jgi:thiol-disulfide isomerase/thioredoxin